MTTMTKPVHLLACLALFAGAASAQTPEPAQGRAWLAQLVGDWDAQFEVLGQAAVPGSESVRALGQHWVCAETETTMMGAPFRGRLSLGYDATTERFHATWIDSMGGHLWVYQAALNESRDTLTLETEGPSMTDPAQTARYREVIRILGADRRSFTSSVETADGEWMEILSIQYHRKKSRTPEPGESGDVPPLRVQYLEIVTPSAEATCNALAKLHGLTFGEAQAEFGNARTAELEGGGRIGVREPMHAQETPVVRPYVLVDDIEAAVEAAKEAGGEIAMGATEIPGQGRFAIYFLGGIQHGLWEL